MEAEGADIEDDAFTGKFKGLVQAWMEANPVQTSALSDANLRFAIYKILILKSGHLAKFSWPGDDAARLAGILFVLFVQEGLQHEESGKSSSRQVIGIDLLEIYGIVRDIIRDCCITREELIKCVKDADLDGTTLVLAESNELAADLYARSSAAGSTSSEPTATEDSRVQWLSPAASGGNVQSPNAQRARTRVRVLWVRNVLVLSSGCFLVAEGWRMLPLPRTVIVVCNLFLAVISTAVIFPETIEGRQGSRFLLPIVVCCLIAMESALGRTLYHRWAHGWGDLNGWCLRVHLLLMAGTAANFSTLIGLSMRSRHSWTALRSVLVVDGVLVCSAVVAMRHLGPLELYPVGDVPFADALGRGLLTLLLGLSASSANRRRTRQLLLWVGARSVMHALEQVGASKHDRDGEEAIAETAHIGDDLGVPGDTAPLLRRHLALRYTRVRLVLGVLPPILILLADVLEMMGSSSGLALFGTLLLIAVLLIVASFPSRLESPEGCHFVQPAMDVLPIRGLLAAYIALTDEDGRRMYIAANCRFVHVCMCTILVANWCAPSLLCRRGQLSWAVMRAVLAFDGFVFCGATLLMRYLGPPPHYQPRYQSSFGQAMVRAAIPVFIATVLLRPINRQRIAHAFHRIGWNHVRLNLNQIEERRVHFSGTKCE